MIRLEYSITVYSAVNVSNSKTIVVVVDVAACRQLYDPVLSAFGAAPHIRIESLTNTSPIFLKLKSEKTSAELIF